MEDLRAGALTLEALRVRATLVEDEGRQPIPLVEEENQTPHLRVSLRVKNGQPPPPQALVAWTRAARTPRSAASIGTLSACRPQAQSALHRNVKTIHNNSQQFIPL